MSDDFAVQFSVKTPRDSLLNLRASSKEEFEALAAWALQNSARFVDLETAVKGVPPALAGNVTHVQVQSNGQQGVPNNEPQGPAPSCQHGPMNFRSGTSKKNGKAWSGWFCGQNQCPTQWA